MTDLKVTETPQPEARRAISSAIKLGAIAIVCLNALPVSGADKLPPKENATLLAEIVIRECAKRKFEPISIPEDNSAQAAEFMEKNRWCGKVAQQMANRYLAEHPEYLKYVNKVIAELQAKSK